MLHLNLPLGVTNEERDATLLCISYHYREPGRFTEVDPDDVCVVQKPVSDEPFSHLATRLQTYQNSELLRHLDIERDELVG